MFIRMFNSQLKSQKAFDMMAHEILIKKIDFYGIKGTKLTWFKSFSNRMQYCCINGINSGNKVNGALAMQFRK